MRKLLVLVACEESQAVCCAFRALGHSAFSCDLVPCSGGHPEWHIQGDARSVLVPGCSFRTQSGGEFAGVCWDIVICHPPCTYLSKAGASRLYPRPGQINLARYRAGVSAAAFFRQCLSAPFSHVAVENPTPLHVFGLPPPSDVVQPYDYGHPYSKRTLLWLRGLPPLMPTALTLPVSSWVSTSTTRGVARSPRLRSRTFAGVAAAMAAQWSRYVLEVRGE